MRFQAIFPALCAFVAMVLGFVCIFAGDKPGYLEDCDILTLNTSRIGVNILEDSMNHHSSDPSSGDSFDAFIHHATSEISNVKHHLEAELESDINNSLTSIAHALGLSDFYSIHVLTHCEGRYTPADSTDPTETVTSCSHPDAFSFFSPTHHLQAQLNASGSGLSLEDDLRWPSAITAALDSLKLAFHVMFVLYALSVTCAGASFLASLAGVFLMRPSEGSRCRVVALVNAGIAQVAFFTLLVASAIVTGGADQAVEVINKYGEEIDVNATKGHKLISMTWAATVLMFVAGIAWFVEWYLEKRRRGLMPKQLQ